MRIAVVRGANLNRFEMQCYVPLTREHEITAFTTWCHSFDLEGIDLVVKKLPSLSSSYGWLPPRMRRLAAAAVSRTVPAVTEYMAGLERGLDCCDIVHSAETYNAYTYQAVRAKAKFGCRVVVTVWENIPFNFEEQPLRRSIKKRVREQADFFVAVTQRAADALILEGVSASKTAIIPVGVDLSKFAPTRKNPAWLQRLGLNSSDVVILFIGRLVRDKGVRDLLFSIKRLLDDGELSAHSLKGLLVGRGPERARLDLLIKELGLQSRVTVADGVSYDQIAEVHTLADIFVLPSTASRTWQEQFGMVLVESMACGKAVVSTLSGSIPEVVGDAGCLVQPGDSLSLSQALKKLILDTELREELGVRARQRVETEFDATLTAQNLHDLYSRIL